MTIKFKRRFLALGLLCSLKAFAALPAAEFKAKRILFEGHRAFTAKELNQTLPISPGDLLDDGQLQLAKQALEGHYQNAGYWEVSIATRVEKMDSGQAALIFQIEEGERFRLRDVILSGNRLIADKIVLREMNLSPGEPFSPLAVYRGTRRLYQSGYFERVDIQYSTAPGREMDVRLALTERPTRHIKGGVGYSAETKERVNIGAEDINFLGNGRRLSFKAVYSGFVTEPEKYRTLLLQADLTQPYLFDTRVQGFTSVLREYRERGSYDSVTTAWRSTLSRALGDFFTLRMLFRYDGTRVTDAAPQAPTEILGFYRLLGAGPGISFDDTDDLFLPTMGWRSEIVFEEGMNGFGIADVRFHRTDFNLGRYESLSRWIFFAGFQSGFIIPDTPGNSIPIPERFTLGGANSVRGYSERELGPKDVNGQPLGGNALAAANIEVRHPIYKKIHGIVFLDGGQLWSRTLGETWPQISVKSARSFRYAAGLGVRFLSPVGPLRLEFGYKLNPDEVMHDFWDRIGIHFALGEPF